MRACATGSAPCTAGRCVLASGRARPGVRADHEPGGFHRRRHGARAPRRGHAPRPGVRPVPPDGDVPRRGLHGPAAADLRGGARRGRVPRRLRGQPVHAGRARARRPRAARRGRQGDHPPDERDRSSAHVAGRPPPGSSVLGEAVSHDPGHRPLARRRPGDRADPGRPGLPLRLRRRPHRPRGALRRTRPLRHRRGRLLRRARRQPAGLQLAARRTGLLPPDRRRAAGRAPAMVGAGRRRAAPPAWCPARCGPSSRT